MKGESFQIIIVNLIPSFNGTFSATELSTNLHTHLIIMKNYRTSLTFYEFLKNGILLPKLFWPTVRKKCSSDREKLLKFEVEGREFAKFLRSLEQFIQTVKGQNNFW